MKRKIWFILGAVVLIAVGALLFYFNIRPADKVNFETSSKTTLDKQGTSVNNIAYDVNPYVGTQKPQFRYQLADKTINGFSIPASISVYELASPPTSVVNNVLSTLKVSIADKFDENSSTHVLVGKTSDSQDPNILAVSHDNGYFDLSSSGLSVAKGTLQEMASTFLQKVNLMDQGLVPTATYKNKSVGDNVTYVEFHRNQVIPTYNPIGLLSLSNKLSDLNFANPGQDLQDQNIYSASDARNGIKRADDFNTVTVGVSSDNKIVALSYHTVKIDKTANLTSSNFYTPDEAFQRLGSTQDILAFVVPDNSSDPSATPTQIDPKDLLSANATISEVGLAYLDNTALTVQKYLQPSYIYRGKATLVPSGKEADFVVAIPALKATNVQFAQSNLAVNADVQGGSDNSVSTSSTTEDALKQQGVGSASQNSRNMQIGAATPPASPSVQPSNQPSTSTSGTPPIKTIGPDCSLLARYLTTVLMLKDRDGQDIKVGATSENTYYAIKQDGSGIQMSSLEIRQKLLDSGLTSVGIRKIWAQTLMWKPMGADSGRNCMYITGESPNIYFYPESQIQIYFGFDVSKLSTGITHIVPSYTSGASWQFVASPDGTLRFANGKSYSSLYYRYTENSFTSVADKFVIASSDLDSFLTNDLFVRLGLNDREKSDYLADIKESLGQVNSPFLAISLASRDQIDKLIPQDISPKPDHWYRNMLEIQPLSKKINSLEPKISPMDRSGFTVVENGVYIVK